MKYLSLCAAIALLAACSEMYMDHADDYVVSHIAFIDTPIQEFTREEAGAHDIYAFELDGGSIPLSFIYSAVRQCIIFRAGTV